MVAWAGHHAPDDAQAGDSHYYLWFNCFYLVKSSSVGDKHEELAWVVEYGHKVCPDVESFVVDHKQGAGSLLNSHAWASTVADTNMLRLNKKKLLFQRFQILQVINDPLWVNNAFIVCHRVFIVVNLKRKTRLSDTRH